MRPTIIAGNWKLHPPREEGVRLYGAIVEGLRARAPWPDAIELWVIPPAPYLGWFASASAEGDPRVGVGSQDISTCDYGAHTGELGGDLLASFGCALALAGHSERRQAGETDALVAEKVLAADRAGLLPLLCVGETEAERDANETEAVVERQLAAVTAVYGADRPLWVAYEPVWAIGTGRTATPEQAVEVHCALRAALDRAGREGAQTPILYGGSVKPGNAATLLAEEEIDGALIGGASLDAESFLAIADAARANRDEPARS